MKQTGSTNNSADVFLHVVGHEDGDAIWEIVTPHDRIRTKSGALAQELLEQQLAHSFMKSIDSVVHRFRRIGIVHLVQHSTQHDLGQVTLVGVRQHGPLHGANDV